MNTNTNTNEKVGNVNKDGFLVRAAKWLEKMNYLWHSSKANVYKLISKAVKKLGKRFLVACKIARSNLGFHTKAERVLYTFSYKAEGKEHNNTWATEAWALAALDVRLENAGRFNEKQLKELRKAASRGYDVAKIADPNLSALDMKLSLPYLKYDVRFTHTTIKKMREQKAVYMANKVQSLFTL